MQRSLLHEATTAFRHELKVVSMDLGFSYKILLVCVHKRASCVSGVSLMCVDPVAVKERRKVMFV